jgi:hypothetical protein
MSELINVLNDVEFAREVFPFEEPEAGGMNAMNREFPTIDQSGNSGSPIDLTFVYNTKGVLNKVKIRQGKSGHEENAHTNTLSELTSLALQHGIPPQALVKTLRGIQGNVRPFIGESKKRTIFSSMEDIVAFQMENYVKAIEEPLNPDDVETGKYARKVLDVPDEGKADYKKLEFGMEVPPLYLFLTGNKEGLLTQVFLSRGKSGGEESAHSESLGKLISLSLRYGVHPYVEADSLIGMQTSLTSMKSGGGGIYQSLEDAIGRIMVDWYKQRGVDLQESYAGLNGKSVAGESPLTGFSLDSLEVEGKTLKEPCPSCESREYEVIEKPGTRGCDILTCCEYERGACS